MNSIVSNRFCRVLILLTVLLEFSANAQSPDNAAPRAIPRRASIILIVADGLGYGDLSCYGQTKFQTPNLDKLAAEGIRFTNYFTVAKNVESQNALMTGEYFARTHQRSHMDDMDMIIVPDKITVAQILKNSGYHTGLIGEWNLGDENSAGAPWRKGFDEFAGYLNPPDAENFYADFMFRYAPITTTGSQPEAFTGKAMLYANSGGKKGQYIPDLYTADALSFIKNNLPDPANHYRPFFLMLNYPIPKTGMTVPTDAPFSGEAWPQAEKNQAAIILRLDGYVGQLQEQLQKLGMSNNVAIFFTSSTIAQKANGIDPEFFQSNISTNDLRVPMIVHWPGKIPAGQVSDFKWSPQDFLPTAASIGFASWPTNLDGISILPFLSRKFDGKTSDLPDQREF